jgi:hypothetical protein
MAEKLLKLSNDLVMSHTFGANGRYRIVELFNIKKQVEKFSTELYRIKML